MVDKSLVFTVLVIPKKKRQTKTVFTIVLCNIHLVSNKSDVIKLTDYNHVSSSSSELRVDCFVLFLCFFFLVFGFFCFLH